MSGNGAQKRYHADCKRAAKLRRERLTLSKIAMVLGIPQEKISERIKIGERLLSLETDK